LANQRLWAPWRLEYIKAARDQARGRVSGGLDECIFCSKPKLGDDAKSLIPQRGERCFVMLNAFPYTNGHVMVAPYEHTADLSSLDDETSLELFQLAQRSIEALGQAYGPDGYNVGFNLGKVAGAGVAHHVHMHVVPRWAGDNNFMPVISDTRVLPQSLEESLATLREAFAALEASR
jgi:ATP adenylyltransferase